MDETNPNSFSEGDTRSARRPREHSARRQQGFIMPALLTAIIFATVFVSITPDILDIRLFDQFKNTLSSQQGVLVINDQSKQGITIGIVSGHMGLDSGTVCDDGTTEADTNFKIATLVQQKLNTLGYKTDLLQEKDPRLQGYKATMLLSIHNDSCTFVNNEATGFKVARAIGTVDQNMSQRLLACLKSRYQQATNLPWHNSVTRDMTEYHAFDEIDPSTPAAIIETGFLNLDYDILTKHTDTVAEGVTNGILCFLQNENVDPFPTQAGQ